MAEYYKVEYSGQKPLEIKEHKEGKLIITEYLYSNGAYIRFKKEKGDGVRKLTDNINVETNKKVKFNNLTKTFVISD
jgi:hypothetical protein